MPLAPPLAVAGAVYDDIVGAYRGFMPSRTRAFLVIHHGPLEPHVRCPYCGARVWSMTAAGLARLSSSSSSDGERSADSDSNHSDDESFAAADRCTAATANNSGIHATAEEALSRGAAGLMNNGGGSPSSLHVDYLPFCQMPSSLTQ
ncbi:hypothetical protein OsJ_09547 [Oryza sativa Japonica Group]|uniref:Uncharacterized protein n=1 Tax=Oryza sativa subsp. japonica TaxID=39947 RepID=A3AEH5_ORYSJ|nr:hypothetical protein OsJ_09547 [Oryza sativa Japonica Group]